jgi:hypothetical protein
MPRIANNVRSYVTVGITRFVWRSQKKEGQTDVWPNA